MLYSPFVNSPSIKYETFGTAETPRPQSDSQGKSFGAPGCWSSMSALFNLSDLITVLLLLICICTYIRGYRKGIFDVEDGTHHGLRGVCWKASRVGERLSPYVGAALLLMAGHVLFFAN